MDNPQVPVIARPASTEAAPYYFKYIDQVEGSDALSALQTQYFTTLDFLKSIPSDKWDYRYENGKWSVREVVGHVLDAERVFAYRALRIARGDKTPMPGFEQDGYVTQSGHDGRSALSLIEEYKAVRSATYSLFESLPDGAIGREGQASGHAVSCRALAWIILGHEKHHVRVIKDMYL